MMGYKVPFELDNTDKLRECTVMRFSDLKETSTDTTADSR